MRIRSLPSAGAALTVLMTCLIASAAGWDDASWRKDLEAWRAQRAAGLQKPDGWLSLTGLEWLREGDNTLGGAADNQIHLAGGAPPHLGALHLEEGVIRLLPPSGGFPADFQVNGHPAESQVVLSDSDEHTTLLKVGTLLMIVIQRGDRYGLRIKDSQAPTRLQFRGLHWYPPNAAYRVLARWIPCQPPKMLSVPTILQTKVDMPSPGAAEFVLDGKTYRLEPVLEDPKDTELFFILRDETSKSTTYGAGRFLYTGFPSNGLEKPGTLILDFNRLYNPPCAFTPYATCPLPPAQNRLPVEIPAGEKRYHD